VETGHQGTSSELLVGCREGDEGAATEVFERYVERLTRLARSRLSPRLASRVDPEDVVLSAWRSFFVGARAGRFSLHRGGDLWRLLVSITMHKLHHQVRRHTADVRSVSVERTLAGTPEEWSAADREPSPEEALALAEELEVVMAGLDGFGRRVLELRLQGEALAAVSEATGRSERSVRRALARIRELLAERLGGARRGLTTPASSRR
jgi:RNA polymerase sigma factor (sigma-70 family)